MNLKTLVKQHIWLLHTIAGIYNIFHLNNYWQYCTRCKFSIAGAFLNRTNFRIKGNENSITIQPLARLNKCHITIIGNHNRLFIGGGHTIISQTHFWLQGDNCEIHIGDDFTMESGHIASTEAKSIIIGDDCMFSDDIEIRNGDSHAILNFQHKRINEAKSVIIGNHVWLGAHVRVMKGSEIPDGCMIGNSSLASGKYDIKNALYAGLPAKLIKEHIIWDRFITKS